MFPTFLLLFTVIVLISLVLKNAKFSSRTKQYLKQTEESEIPCNNQEAALPVKVPLPDVLVVLVKLVYYRYIMGLPNYEAAHLVMAKLGHNLCGRLPFGSTEYQITDDPVVAKRILSDTSWPDRFPLGYYLQDAGFHKPYGLLMGGGKHYKSANRITVKLLQRLGFFSPATMEGRFVFEMEELERKFDVELASNGGEHTFCPTDIFGFLSINVAFHILLGKRNPFDEATVTKLLSSIMTSNTKMAPVTTFLEIIQFLRHFPSLTFLKYMYETSDMIYDVLREVIAEKREAGTYKEHVGDFVDGLLQHVDNTEGCEDGLNEENMLVLLRDMLFAGADTTGATIAHALLFMALRQEIQEKVQAEIDVVIGPDRAPSCEDRRRMPYTEATLHEIFRVGSSSPGTARAKQEGNRCSYVLINLYGIHRNEAYYDEPNEFKPERFLDKENPNKVVNTEHLMSFGYGRRSCTGEIAARVAVFIYFVTMLRNYSIKLSSRHPPPSMRNTDGFSRTPLRYYITIRKRH